ncbi:MAG: hypothetical protein MUF34_08325 [Polyangiaceae bacterium]|jgi:hypothetical protein|nr:hypothetical protein [Polyangiaceae bacterium]
MAVDATWKNQQSEGASVAIITEDGMARAFEVRKGGSVDHKGALSSAVVSS